MAKEIPKSCTDGFLNLSEKYDFLNELVRLNFFTYLKILTI